MPVSIRPLGDRVLVEPVESEETFAGGAFVLPETAKEKPQQGLIRAAGPGKYDEEGEKRIPMDVAEATASCSPNTLAPKSSLMASAC